VFLGSIRQRLTAWYSLSLALILLAISIFWYVTLSRSMIMQMDRSLHETAKVVELGHLQELDVVDPEQACAILEVYSYSQDWLGYVQLRDPAGELACIIQGVNGKPLPLGAEARTTVKTGNLHYNTELKAFSFPVRMLSVPVYRQGEIVRILQVGENSSGIEQILSDLRAVSIFLSPIVILMLAAFGWFLAGRVLSPIVDITATAQKITAEKLNRRLPVAETEDELSRLAQTFNLMLGRLEDSFSRIRRFSGDASHELRTPLAIIKGETEVALRWAKSDAELRSALESNLEEIDRMERIVADLLSLARSDAAKLHLDISRFSLTDLLQDVWMCGKALAEQHRHAVHLDYAVTAEIYIHGDQLQLYRVMMNILTNATNYTPPDGRIDIRLHVEEEQALIEIADTGLGISPEDLPHIFERFYRIDSARNRDQGGTGLGLAIVKAIVTAHGGTISVDSTVGEGTTFSVSLPLNGPADKIVSG
jgi:heavy metal sensor kinase